MLETNAKCPKCGAKVIERKTKKGYTFYGCSNWPGCDFMTWDKPTDEVCPQCGKSLFKKKRRHCRVPQRGLRLHQEERKKR